MKFLRKFNEHTSYEAELNVGGQDFEIPNVSYCKNVDDVHFNPYNLIEFYVGAITPPQTVSIYTDETNHVDVIVSEGYKWYSYLLPKDKGLYKIEGDSVKKVVVKADIKTTNNTIIPSSTLEASFKGSNTSKVTVMGDMFRGCSGLTSLDVSNFNTSNVTLMASMFRGCSGLTTLDLSGWNISNVTYMNSMFVNCTKLKSLDLSGWNTSNVTDMGGMFSDCRGLTSLDLSGWNMSKVTNMSGMFNGCSNSLTIRMKGCSVETVGKIQTQLTADGITGAQITTE